MLEERSKGGGKKHRKYIRMGRDGEGDGKISVTDTCS